MRLAVLSIGCLVALAATAHADIHVRFDARTVGSRLEITFTNTGDQPVEIPIRIDADIANYDWLTVELTAKSGGKRKLGFMTARRAAALRTAKLVPKASTTESIDLVPWAFRDGTRLAEGTYELTAIWDASRDGPNRISGRSKTTLSIAAPVASPKACPSAAGTLELLARHVGTAGLEVGLHNAGTTTLCIQAPEGVCAMSDATLTFQLDPATKQTKVIRFIPVPQACDKSTTAPIVELPAGATLWKTTTIVPSVRGPHHGEVVYEMKAVTRKSGPNLTVWTGKLATPIAFRIP